jgi:hypothetical protein
MTEGTWMTLGTAMDLAAVASLSAALVFLALTWWQYGEERVTKAFHEGQAKQTGRARQVRQACRLRLDGGGLVGPAHRWWRRHLGPA